MVGIITLCYIYIIHSPITIRTIRCQNSSGIVVMVMRWAIVAPICCTLKSFRFSKNFAPNGVLYREFDIHFETYEASVHLFFIGKNISLSWNSTNLRQNYSPNVNWGEPKMSFSCGVPSTNRLFKKVYSWYILVQMPQSLKWSSNVYNTDSRLLKHKLYWSYKDNANYHNHIKPSVHIDQCIILCSKQCIWCTRTTSARR